MASDLTLADVQRFAEQFLTHHHRQLQKKKPFVEFLVPEQLKPWKLPERICGATFDRDLAIERSDAEFLALGHPLVNAMLEYAGSYDFGGLTAVRHLNDPKLSGKSGFLFLFIVRQRIAHEAGDECLFQMCPVFVGEDGLVDEGAAQSAVQLTSRDNGVESELPDPASFFQTAREFLTDTASLWDWDEDVEFLGLSWVEFV